MTTLRRSGVGLLCILASTLAACGGSGEVDDQSLLTPPSAGDIGYLNLSVSDAPIKNATKVCIRFDGVELKHADSEETVTIEFDEPEVVNLLANQGANSQQIVALGELPGGAYEWLRLKVQAERGLGGGANDGDLASDLCDAATENSYLVRNSIELHNLFVPSGSQRGLQLIKEIIIPINRAVDYTAEWDLGKSFNGPRGLDPDVMMKPVVKLVANDEVGTLVGQVADELIALDSCDAEFAPSVYVFDDGIAPNPLPLPDDPFADDDAVATGLVEQQEQEDGSMPWRYSIGFLLAGNYEVAFTCNGTDFIPLAGKPAEIFVDDVTTVDFLAEDAPPLVGSLSGAVAAELVEATTCVATFDPAVYVFGENVTPSNTADSVATGTVSETAPYEYMIQDLVAGTYNAAFTCTGTDFEPPEGKEAVITIGEDTPLDF